MEVCELPEELKKIMGDNNISEYCLVSQNSRKGRWCLKAHTFSDGWVMLKWNSEKPSEAYSSLCKEQEIYIALKDKKITPMLISCTSLFLTEYIEDSRTLRQYMLNIGGVTTITQTLPQIIEKTLRQYIALLDGLKEVSNNRNERITYSRQQVMYLSKLMYSGPEGSRIHRIEKAKNKILGFLVKKFGVITRFGIPVSKETMIHGDFHLNNELVDTQNNIFIIDFENAIYGSATLELAYWYVQVWILLFEEKKYIGVLDEEINKVLALEYFDENAFWNTVSLYKAGISMNSRFHKFEKRIPLGKRIELWSDVVKRKVNNENISCNPGKGRVKGDTK